MSRPGILCNINLKDAINEVFRIGDDFIDAPELKNKISDPSGFVKEVYTQTFRIPWKFRDDISYNKGELKIFENRLSSIRRSISNDSFQGKIGEFLYSTAFRSKNNPIGTKLLNDIISAGYYYKGNQETHKMQFRSILDNVKQHNNASFFLSTLGTNESGQAWNKAVKMASDFDSRMEKVGKAAMLDPNDMTAHDEFRRLKTEEDNFYKQGEGKILNEFLDHVEKDIPKIHSLLKKEYYDGMYKEVDKMRANNKSQASIDTFMSSYEKSNKITYDKIFNTIDPKTSKPIIDTKSEHMNNALKDYVKLMEGMHHTLVKGVKSFASAIKEANSTLKSPKDLANLEESILEKIMPDKKIGFYPHYKRFLGIDFMENMMPHMQKVSENLSDGLQMNEKSIQDALDGMNTFLSGHVKQRAPGNANEANAQIEYSRNFVANIKRYVDEVDRFNFMAQIDLKSRQALTNARTQFKDGADLSGYGLDTVKLLVEMNQAAKGTNMGFDNKNLESISRSLLGMEFTSKLGLNIRSGFKNGTQTLLNFVEFGPRMWSQTNKFYDMKGLEFNSKVEKMLEESGLKFIEMAPEMQEITGQMVPEGSSKFKLDPNGRLSDNAPSSLSRMEGVVNYVAGKSGFMMRRVENWNRTKTFKIGFAKMYKELDGSSSFKNKLRAEGKSEAQIENQIMSMAREYSINMTTALHFDYSNVSKSKFIRNKYGRFLGQFQHYGFKFWEYNAGLLKNAAADIKTGNTLMEKYYGPNSAKAMRMGMIYFMAPAFASWATGLDLEKLVQHDTAERIQKLGAAMLMATGLDDTMDLDDDMLNKMYYGSGPIIGNIGFPLASDMLKIGHMSEWYDMDEDSMLAKVIGFQDYAKVSGDKKAYEIVRILNTQIGRSVYQTLPMAFDGKLGTAVQFEAGMYPKKKNKSKNNVVREALDDYTPDQIKAALDLINEGSDSFSKHRKRAMYPKTNPQKEKVTRRIL
tara:strand:+ start:19438 stop:22353 length:2916 start_codon:yes stop_codon:yes gene_type:complete